MRTFFSLASGALLFLACAAGAFLTLEQIVGAHFAAIAEEDTERLINLNAFYHPQIYGEELRRLPQLWRRGVRAVLVSPEALYNLGQAEILASGALTGMQRKTARCSAQAHFERASILSPHRPLYQLALADLAVQLQQEKIDCARPNLTHSEILDRLDWAEKLAPLSITDTYWSAFVYLAFGDRSRGLKLLRRNQEINPFFTEDQRRFAFGLVRSPDELRDVLPRRYPQTLQWINYFASERPEAFDAWQEAFLPAFKAAVSDLEARFEKGELEFALYSSYLKNLGRCALTERSREMQRRLDRLLSSIYRQEGNEQWADVLDKRSAGDRIAVLKGFLPDDRHPNTTPLARWIGDESRQFGALDALGRAIGVYIPHGTEPRLIVLESAAESPRLPREALQVFVSDDNLVYENLYGDYELLSIAIDGRSAIVLALPQKQFRYLKIVYSGSSQKPKFHNRFASLIQVYGNPRP